GRDEHLGLVELGTQEGTDTVLGQVAGQSAALERLEVDAKVLVRLAAGLLQVGQVGVEDVEVDQQRGSVERGERLAGKRGHGRLRVGVWSLVSRVRRNTRHQTLHSF